MPNYRCELVHVREAKPNLPVVEKVVFHVVAEDAIKALMESVRVCPYVCMRELEEIHIEKEV